MYSNQDKQSFFIDFSKASTDAVETILNALNAEVDEAISQNRMPILENAFERLGQTSKTIM